MIQSLGYLGFTSPGAGRASDRRSPPGLIEADFRATNRPTHQQVLELAPAG